MTPRRLNPGPQGINNVFLETVLQYLARTSLPNTMSAQFVQRRRTQAFLYRIRNSTNAVLQYDFDNDSLSVWKW